MQLNHRCKKQNRWTESQSATREQALAARVAHAAQSEVAETKAQGSTPRTEEAGDLEERKAQRLEKAPQQRESWKVED